MSDEDEYAIWWTTQAEVDAIKTHFGSDLVLPAWCPNYLQAAFASRAGRPGRGRLWVSSELEFVMRQLGHRVPSARFNPEHGTALQTHCEGAGGIVIGREDIRTLAHLPGIVTDFDLVRVA